MTDALASSLNPDFLAKEHMLLHEDGIAANGTLPSRHHLAWFFFQFVLVHVCYRKHFCVPCKGSFSRIFGRFFHALKSGTAALVYPPVNTVHAAITVGAGVFPFTADVKVKNAAIAAQVQLQLVAFPLPDGDDVEFSVLRHHNATLLLIWGDPQIQLSAFFHSKKNSKQ